MRSFGFLKYAIGRNFLYKNILVRCLGMKSPAKGSVDCKLTGYIYRDMIKKENLVLMEKTLSTHRCARVPVFTYLYSLWA